MELIEKHQRSQMAAYDDRLCSVLYFALLTCKHIKSLAMCNILCFVIKALSVEILLGQCA